MTNASLLAASTPGTRDRYIDLLRVGSLGVVVVGHWLMAVILVEPGGGVRATNALALLPVLQPLTWLLQVMPVFFFVGGFSHTVTVASLRRRGAGYAEFVATRAHRLLRPTGVFVGIWLFAALIVEITGHDRGVLRLATRTVAQPLWFVGVYLGIVGFAPVMVRLQHRLGRRGVWVPVVLGAGAMVVDVARLGLGVPYVGYLNVALVWLAVHQLGVLYGDGVLVRRRVGLAMAGGGLLATLALITFGPYPVSMVGVPGERISNMSPPTLALLAHAVWLIGLVLLVRGPVTRWLRRARVWTAVIVANGLAMTAFLWHLTAMFLASGVVLALGLAQPPVGSAAWWLLRPVWIAVLAMLTAALVLVFRRADRPRADRRRADQRRADRHASGRPGPAVGVAIAVTGIVLSVIGVLGVSVAGFGGLLAGRSATLVVLPVTPLISACVLAAGAALLAGGRGARWASLRPPSAAARAASATAPAQATSTGVPPVRWSNSAKLVRKTACGIPPAAQTSSYPDSAASTRVRMGSGCPTGATPPIG